MCWKKSPVVCGDTSKKKPYGTSNGCAENKHLYLASKLGNLHLKSTKNVNIDARPMTWIISLMG